MPVKLSLLLYEPEKEPRSMGSELSSGEKLVVGRGQSADVWLNDKNISREHCQIICENDTIFVEDLGSRNGTFLNDERVTSKTTVSEGDEIRLASSSTLKVSLERKATSFPLDSSLIGKVFNGYRVDARIGSGGMAVVYKGVQLALNRPVAIKTLAHHLIQNPKARARFLTRGKLSGQLTHPNIVQTYDIGSLDEYGIYYIVMEYVEGESLNHILQEKGMLPVEQTCKIIGHIAGALDYANKKSIIHRDINPSNILVGKEGVPKLIGLALAKCLDNEASSLTQQGKAMGMMGYIALEQLQDAAKTNHRSDIYALGAVFYHCLCGQMPYDTKNMKEYFEKMYSRVLPVPPHELNPKVPRAISDMVMKALAFDPEERYNTAGEFLLDLKPYFTPRTETKIGETIREKLSCIFSPPKILVAGFEFESVYKPVEGIGGDFYDFIELNNHELGIVIGDVTGHGLEAAAVVGMVKIAIKIVGKMVSDTAKALHRANQEIYPYLDPTTFATVAYGIIDRSARTLRFSRAGHNPLILYNPDRNPPLTTYDPKGMVVGMFSKCECEEITIPLVAGDCLIQYTDGVTEAMNSEREEFGVERLGETVCSVKAADLGKIVQTIEEAITQFVGAEGQQDDVTVVGIKVL